MDSETPQPQWSEIVYGRRRTTTRNTSRMGDFQRELPQTETIKSMVAEREWWFRIVYSLGWVVDGGENGTENSQ